MKEPARLRSCCEPISLDFGRLSSWPFNSLTELVIHRQFRLGRSVMNWGYSTDSISSLKHFGRRDDTVLGRVLQGALSFSCIHLFSFILICTQQSQLLCFIEAHHHFYPSYSSYWMICSPLHLEIRYTIQIRTVASHIPRISPPRKRPQSHSLSVVLSAA